MSIQAMKQALEALEKMVTPRNFQTHQFCQKAYDDLRQAIAEAEKQEPVAYTTGHCKEKAQPNGCQLHNLHCGYPACDRKAVAVPQPKREPLTEWKPIETAPKDTEVLLYCNKFIPLYIGKKRYGCLGEPQQDEFEWRCSSSGRFANPTYWMPLPKSPIEAARGIKGEA